MPILLSQVYYTAQGGPANLTDSSTHTPRVKKYTHNASLCPDLVGNTSNRSFDTFPGYKTPAKLTRPYSSSDDYS